MEINECINYLLTNAQNGVFLRFKERLLPFDVTPAQYMALYYLKEESSLSPTALAKLCRLDASTMTGILTRLEKKGLVERRHSENDRRSVDICITEQGQTMMPELLVVIEDCNAEALHCLSEKEQNALKTYLDRLISAAE